MCPSFTLSEEKLVELVLLHKECIFYVSVHTFTRIPSVLTCVFAAVHLQVRKLEVAFVAAWVGAHERTLLTAF